MVAYIVIYIFDFNKTFSSADEFSHWGEMIKEMIRLDKFYSVDTSTLMVHKDYPPIMQLLELFYCNIAGGYKEPYLVRCMNLFCFSLFIPFFDSSKKFYKVNNIIKTFFIMGIVFFVVLLFDMHNIINTIYNDYLMAILVAYLFGVILFSKNPLSNFNLIALSIGCSFLIFTKQIALTLYLMVLFMFCLDVILKYKKGSIKYSKKDNVYIILKVLVLLIIIPLLFWKGWGMYVEKLNLDQQFKLSDIKLKELPSIVHGTSGKKYQIVAASNYIGAIKEANIITSDVLKLSYVQCFALVILLLCLLGIYGKKYFCNKELFLLAVTLAIGLIGYAFVLLVMYVFSFGPVEGPALASFDRYMDTYILLCMTLLIMLFIFIDNKKDIKGKSLKNVIIAFLVLIIMQSPGKFVECFPSFSPRVIGNFKYHADNISRKTEEDSKVFIISQGSDGGQQYYIKYYMNPRITNLKKYNLPVTKIDNYEDYFDKKVNDYMLDYDYLYLADIDKKFIERYKFVFPDNNIKETNLYKINNDDGKVKLEKVS